MTTAALDYLKTRISDVRRAVLVVKDGVVYSPERVYRALGVKP
jgi:hypothetical protein